MQVQNNNTHIYFEGLNVWRGIAIIAVLISHYFSQFNICKLGWIGVDIFFVLSGFLISNILLTSKKNEKIIFFNFYLRRFLRIIPVYFLFLLCFYTIIIIFHKQQIFSYYIRNWWYYPLFIQNWLYIIKGQPHEYYLTHLWSLSVEEQFYIIWPFIIYFLKQKFIKTFLIISIIVVTIVRIILYIKYPLIIELYYFNTFTRIDSILIGCLLATCYRSKIKYANYLICFIAGLIILGMILYQDVSFNSPFFGTIGYTLISILSFFLLYVYINNKNINGFKKNKTLNYIGKISYCIYLIHMPVYLFVLHKFKNFNFSFFDKLSNPVISIIITITISALSWKYIESKFLSLKGYFPMVHANINS